MREITKSNELVWKRIPDLKGKSVLDLSCGPGNSTHMLVGLGMEVTCTNYDKDRHAGIPEAATYVGGVDLNERWPFEDGSFDCVNMQEVIEHLQNVTHVISEISRVLKLGGHMVLSTPNILNLKSRVHFLFTGFYEGRKRPIGYSKALGDAGNVYMTNLPQMHYIMAQRELSIRNLGIHQVAAQSYVLYLPLYPFIAFATYIVTRRPRKNSMMDYGPRQHAKPGKLEALVAKQKPVSARVRRLMLSRPALLSRNIIVHAEKTGLGPFEA